MMGQNKLFSSIYIGGTALAIAATTLYAMLSYVKIAPIYPEYNRDRTVIFDRVHTTDAAQNEWQSQAGYDLVTELLYNLDDADVVTSFYDSWDNENYIKGQDGETEIKVVLKPIDHNFFKVYEYEFLEGKPFGEIDLRDRQHVAVVSAGTAEKAFGTWKGVVGRDIMMNFVPYRVVGVVKDASSVFDRSFGEVFTPYTTVKGYDSRTERKYHGSFRTTILTGNVDGIRAQAKEFERRFNTSQDEIALNLVNQPLTHLRWVFNPWPHMELTVAKALRGESLMLLILLLVPALNLSSLISSRMDMRSSELGVRKTFGASRRVLLWQIMWENLLLTGIGAVAGLVIVWAMMLFTSGDILTVSNGFFDDVAAPTSINVDMFFSPGIFFIVLGLCLLLNMLSALVPAWVNLRKPIVLSLKEK